MEAADELVVTAGALVVGGALVVADAVLDGGSELEAGGVALPVPSPDVVVESGGAERTVDPRLGMLAPVVSEVAPVPAEVVAAVEPDDVPGTAPLPTVVEQPASRTAAPKRHIVVRRTDGIGMVMARLSAE